MPESLALVEALRADGIPAVISGAGPTVLAFTDGPGSVATEELLARCPEGWGGHALAVSGTAPRRTTAEPRDPATVVVH